jgi:preprotein translocase subunit YajC
MPEFLAQETPVPTQPAPGPGTAPAGGQGTGNAPVGCGDPNLLILMLLMWGVIWFFVLRPQGKAEKQRKARIAGVQKGDRVRTRGGIVAPVVRVKDDEVVLRLDADQRVEITVAKSYLDEVMTEDGGDGKKKE